jgi:hypothetical protein
MSRRRIRERLWRREETAAPAHPGVNKYVEPWPIKQFPKELVERLMGMQSRAPSAPPAPHR